MSNDMKLIMESWRNYNITEDLTNENLGKKLDKIRSFFGMVKKEKPLELGSFKMTEKYDAGTYGDLAQKLNIVNLIHRKHKITADRQRESHFEAAYDGLFGADAKSGSSLAMGVLLAALAPILPAVVAKVAGAGAIGLAVKAVIKAARKDPTVFDGGKEAEMLKNFVIDKEYSEILDDKLEAELVEKYEKTFLQQLEKNPNNKITPINSLLQIWLRGKSGGRTVAGAPNSVFKLSK